ncbi:GTP-binding protein [Candidatus Woesearchaeota archaeon]|nr:GTP-binding protein [Candidatus Woesearchaeota archaeon]
MVSKTPLILLAGYLGSGKTTLLLHLLSQSKQKIAVLMNEFGDVGIDTDTIKGENIQIKELLEGCVCCSLVGEFEAAVKEIITKYHPELIIVETTGIAEADNLVLSVRDSLSQVDLKSVVTVVDADLMIRFPSLGHNIELQVQAADVLILNKIDLVSKVQVKTCEERLHKLNSHARIITTKHGKIDFASLLSAKLASSKVIKPVNHKTTMQTFSLSTTKITKKNLEEFLQKLPKSVMRCKGYVTIGSTQYLVNYVRGRWTIEKGNGTQKLVFIGENVTKDKIKIVTLLKKHLT